MELGVNFSGGPYDPGYFTQSTFGSAIVGSGIEFPVPFRTVDFGAELARMTLNSSAAELPFNGYTWTFDPSVTILDVIFLDSDIPGMDQNNFFFNPNKVSLDLDGRNVGFVDFRIVSSSVVPIPAAAWLFGFGLIGLIGVARRKRL